MHLPAICACNTLQCSYDPQEYAAFKDTLMDNTRKSGAVVAAYLLLTVDGGVSTQTGW